MFSVQLSIDGLGTLRLVGGADTLAVLAALEKAGKPVALSLTAVSPFTGRCYALKGAIGLQQEGQGG